MEERAASLGGVEERAAGAKEPPGGEVGVLDGDRLPVPSAATPGVGVRAAAGSVAIITVGVEAGRSAWGEEGDVEPPQAVLDQNVLIRRALNRKNRRRL